MINIDRTTIHILNRHSNWPEARVGELLKDKVYNDLHSWKIFLRLFFITLGVGFTTSGIIFFFAYNWVDLHKFVKIGLIEGLIVVTTLVVLISKFNPVVKHILLTGSVVLVGGLIAVFGQIYQTGANAYDFFLLWTVLVTLWIVVSDFAPLWLIWITLINTTLFLYAQQVAFHWSEVVVCTVHFMLNTLFLILFIGLSKRYPINVPKWFTNTTALAAVAFSTFGIAMGIFEDFQLSFVLLIMLAAIFYSAGMIYGYNTKNRFYLAIVALSIIIVIASILIEISDSEGMLLLISFFIIGSVTFVISNLMKIQKKWDNG